MKIKCIDYVDEICDERIYALVVTKVPKRYVKEAKKIDGSDYCSTCFGIYVMYNNDDGYYIPEENCKEQLYYIDFSGIEHWFNYSLTELEKKAAIEICEKDTEWG